MSDLLTLAAAPDKGLECVLAKEQVKLIRDEIAAVVEVADRAIERLRALAGPEPGDFAASLKVQINMGAGYFRAAKTDIDEAWRRLNARKRGARK